MSTESETEYIESKKAKEYKSFPDGGLRDVDYRTLRNDERFEDVHPVAAYNDEDCITHIGFVYSGYERIIGWNPEDEKWIEIVKFERAFESDEPVNFDVAHPFDDETNKPIIRFIDYFEDENFSLDGLYRYVEDYIDHKYDDPPTVFYFMGE